jgi:hypothetical protein
MAGTAGPGILKNNLVLWVDGASMASYPGTGTTWFDVSPPRNNAIITNGPTYSPTEGYGSFLFDGVNDYMDFGLKANLLFLNTSPYTLETVVRPNIDPGNGNFSGLFDREGTFSGSRDGFNCWFLGSGTTTCQFGTERFVGGTEVSVTESLLLSQVLNRWHHIVVVYTGSQLTLYRNGNLIGTVNDTRNITNNNKSLWVGRRSGNYFSGNIATSRVYSIALTVDQVKENYSAIRRRFDI